jgi:ferritin-like metal-binding protein YciE
LTCAAQKVAQLRCVAATRPAAGPPVGRRTIEGKARPRFTVRGGVARRTGSTFVTTHEIGAEMTTSEQKVLQYLHEAYATERALVRVLESQIAMAPRGSYRDGLERHLRETRDHAQRVGSRLEELGHHGDPLSATIGVVETVIGQVLALSKAPFDILRGSGGEEKVLKNAKDACATEALEVATYTALERLARSVGDETTARLAESIRADEERMLARVLEEIPRLTDAVARQARKVPGVARAEGHLHGAVASEDDLAIGRYDTLTAEEIIGRLADLSQVDLAKVAAYERKHRKRSTVLRKIDSLSGAEPWPGYDELTADDVRAHVAEGDDDLANEVHAYERAHKNRAGVLEAAEREAATA